VWRPNDLKEKIGGSADTFYDTQLNALAKQNKTRVKDILDNNLKLSEVSNTIDTSVAWADAAKVHVTKFYTGDIKAEIKKWIAANKDVDCGVKDEWLEINQFKVFMGATAGIRNVINGYILQNVSDDYKRETDNLKTLLGGGKFFADFLFGYIAGRTEGMFGLIVGLNAVTKDKEKQKKLLYV
jgi:hypothetical protein